MTDPFEDFADRNSTAYNRARMRAAETKAERELAKKQFERDFIFEEWKKWHEERKVALLAGPHGEQAQELCYFLETMTIADAAALVELVKRGAWHETNADTRFLVQTLIGRTIMCVRECEGLPPFDDPLPFSDEELNASLIIRELLK